MEIEQETGHQLHALFIHNDYVINDHNDCIIDAFLWLQKLFITHSRPCLCMRENAEEMIFRVFIQDIFACGGK